MMWQREDIRRTSPLSCRARAQSTGRAAQASCSPPTLRCGRGSGVIISEKQLSQAAVQTHLNARRRLPDTQNMHSVQLKRLFSPRNHCLMANRTNCNCFGFFKQNQLEVKYRDVRQWQGAAGKVNVYLFDQGI